MAARKVETPDGCDDFFNAADQQPFGAEVRFNREWTKAIVVSAGMRDAQLFNANTVNIRFQSINYLVNVTYHGELFMMASSADSSCGRA
jgi:hypothetical protein